MGRSTLQGSLEDEDDVFGIIERKVEAQRLQLRCGATFSRRGVPSVAFRGELMAGESRAYRYRRFLLEQVPAGEP